MQKLSLMISIALMASLASSCLTTGGSKAPASQPLAVAEAGGEYVLTRIANSELPSGKCGMILWTLEADRPAPVFQYLSGEDARLALNGVPLNLSRTSAGGTTAFGVSETQIFADATGVYAVKVSVTMGLGFEGGTYLERGLISMEGPDGWRTVTPVAGVAGCRNN